MRKITVALLFCVCFASAAFAGEKLGTIGVSLMALNNPFFKTMAENMAAEAAKHGYEVVVVDGNLDVPRQANQVKDFIASQYAGIILAPCDSMAIGPAIKEANDAGIPVFTVDAASLAPDAEVVTHVATDNLSGGKIAADAMIAALGGQGKIGFLEHVEVESVMFRTQGFEARLKELGKDADMPVVSRLPSNGFREKSYQFTLDMMQANPDIVGIFACNDPAALGCLAALESIGRADAVTIIGFDGNPEAKQAIRDGKIYGSSVQFPDRLGAVVVQQFVKYMNGEETPREILIPTAMYLKADAEKELGAAN